MQCLPAPVSPWSRAVGGGGANHLPLWSALCGVVLESVARPSYPENVTGASV